MEQLTMKKKDAKLSFHILPFGFLKGTATKQKVVFNPIKRSKSANHSSAAGRHPQNQELRDTLYRNGGLRMVGYRQNDLAEFTDAKKSVENKKSLVKQSTSSDIHRFSSPIVPIEKKNQKNGDLTKTQLISPPIINEKISETMEPSCEPNLFENSVKVRQQNSGTLMTRHKSLVLGGSPNLEQQRVKVLRRKSSLYGHPSEEDPPPTIQRITNFNLGVISSVQRLPPIPISEFPDPLADANKIQEFVWNSSNSINASRKSSNSQVSTTEKKFSVANVDLKNPILQREYTLLVGLFKEWEHEKRQSAPTEQNLDRLHRLQRALIVQYKLLADLSKIDSRIEAHQSSPSAIVSNGKIPNSLNSLTSSSSSDSNKFSRPPPIPPKPIRRGDKYVSLAAETPSTKPEQKHPRDAIASDPKTLKILSSENEFKVDEEDNLIIEEENLLSSRPTSSALSDPRTDEVQRKIATYNLHHEKSVSEDKKHRTNGTKLSHRHNLMESIRNVGGINGLKKEEKLEHSKTASSSSY